MLSVIRVGEVIHSCLGHSNQKAVQFQIIGDRRKSASKTFTLHMGRADFGQLKEVLNKVSQKPAFASIRVHEC